MKMMLMSLRKKGQGDEKDLFKIKSPAEDGAPLCQRGKYVALRDELCQQRRKFICEDYSVQKGKKSRIMTAREWRGARVVEWDGLENRCTFQSTEGSNLSLRQFTALALFRARDNIIPSISLSAIFLIAFQGMGSFCFLFEVFERTHP